MRNFGMSRAFRYRDNLPYSDTEEMDSRDRPARSVGPVSVAMKCWLRMPERSERLPTAIVKINLLQIFVR